MADTLKNGFTYTDASQESKFINIILDGNNVQTGENSNLNQTLEKNESKQEKTQEKTISCLTALSINKINGTEPAYFKDILYYKNYIFYILNNQNENDYIRIIDCSNSQEMIIYDSNNKVQYYWPTNTLKKLYIIDDEEAYYLYVGSIDNLQIELVKIKIPKNSGTDSIYLTQRYNSSNQEYTYCSDATKQILYQYTLDANYTFNGFYINADETRGFVSLTDSTGNYLLTMPLSTTSAYEEPSGLIISPNSQVHVKLDRFKTDQFYSIYGNQALSMTGGTSYNTALKTIALPYTIDDTIGHVDYFGDFIVYTENGITFYITNTNTSETKTLICEDDLLSLESNDITTLRVKKYTLTGELQFYIGTSQGRHIKFYSDTESFVRINYDFISPYAKSVLKIEADPYKNTENILICYNTARNQARILNENIKMTGASTLAAQYDTIANLETEINAIDSDVHSNYQSILILDSDVSRLEGYVKQGTIISIDQLNTITKSGLYTIYTGNDESILPIARVPDENVVIQHINPWGSGNYGYAITQIIHYTSQNRSFIRYRENMPEQPSSSNSQYWSKWSEILVTNNTDNFSENKLLITGDNKQIENYDINPKDIITQKNPDLISDELDTVTTDAEDIFINGGNFYDSRSISGTSWPSVSGDLSSCTLSSNSILTDSNLYLFSKSAVDTGTITLPEAIQNDFTSYDQTSLFKFHFGFILDYDSSGASQIEVLRVFDSFVMHMNSNSSVRIVATTRANGGNLKVSDWLSSTGLCAIAIDGSNNGEITLAVQPLYEDYTKKGTLISDTITLSSTDKLFCSPNINNRINLRANMNLSCFFVETGTSISSLTASELIDKMLEMRTLKSSPIATQDYVDAKTAGIPYCTCSTSASVSAKIVNNAPDSFVLKQGARILVKFTNSNTVSSPTLNVNGTGAKSIKVYGTTAPLTYAWHADAFIEFIYDGTYWILMNREPASTTHAGIVKLSSSRTSTSTTTAATSSAVKALQDQLDGITNLTLSTDLSYEAIS